VSDYRNVIRLAREVEAVRTALDSAITPAAVDALALRVEGLHAEVGAALVAHAATRPWYSRWLWAWRIRRFERHAVSS
jgi:hypothetical protein